MLRPAASCLLGVCAVLGGAAPALAAPSPGTVLLEWDAPNSCPDASAVYRRVGELLGHSPIGWGPVDPVRGVVVQQAGQWLLTIEMREGSQRLTRLITAPRCDDLAEAAAIAISLAIEGEQEQPSAPAPGAVPGNSAQAMAPAPGAGRASHPSVPSDEALGPQEEGHSALGVSVSAEGVLDVNALGSLAPGVSIGAAVRVQRVSLGLYGVVLPAQSQAVSAQQSVTFGLLALGLRGCYGLLDDRVALAACAGLEAGRLHADSRGLSDSRRVNDLWLAPGAGLELRANIRPTLALELRAEVLRPLPRKQYAVDETVVIHRPPALAPRLYLGVSWSVD